MKTLIIILWVLVFTVPYFCQTEIQPEPELKGFLPKFFYDALNYKSDQPGKTRVDIYIEVPFVGIQFLKSDQGFTANYNITVSFFDESKEKLITEKSWIETVNSKSFEGTVSKNNYFLSVKSFDLQPRTYFLRCEVSDQDSKKSYVREEIFVVRDLSAPVGLSDIMLVSKTRVVNGQEVVVPNISKNVAAQREGLSIYYEVYSDTAKNAAVEYSIVDDKKESVFSQSDTHPLNAGRNVIKYTITYKQLDMGMYNLYIRMKKANGDILAESNKIFFSRWSGLPSSVKDLDKAIDEMVYIATPSELNNIKDAPNQAEKSKRFVEFWQKKDPSPSTEENEVFEEYFRRVTYANEHFKHYQEGWRTDMGMVYITLGIPNNIERHPFEFDSKPYEIWDYYDINRRFVFIDETGFGDYRLTVQPYGNWWKYRQ